MLTQEHRKTIEACRFCFMCRHMCTVSIASGKESDTPRGKALILFKTLAGYIDYDDDLIDTLYRCCLCGMCETWCQAKCLPAVAVVAARADVVAMGREPAKVKKIMESLTSHGNPFGLPADKRFAAIDTKDLVRPKAEVLYYVGCDAAYHQPEIAGAMIRSLRAAKVEFGILPDEHATGKQLFLLGYREQARVQAESLVAKIRRTGCKLLVTTCPTALEAFLVDYPAMGIDLSGIEVLHATQYLERLADDGRLRLRPTIVDVVAVLDGTYLGRHHKVFDEPRSLVGRTATNPVKEMVWTRELAYSCGEPGGVFQLLQPGLSADLCGRVLEEATKSGVKLLATTCPATKTAIAASGRPGPAVRDVVELVADALG